VSFPAFIMFTFWKVSWKKVNGGSWGSCACYCWGIFTVIYLFTLFTKEGYIVGGGSRLSRKSARAAAGGIKSNGKL
jgi:hypothetical protein